MRCFLASFSALLLLAALHAAARADWTRFRGADGSAVSGETGLPTTWSEDENLVWKKQMPGEGASSAITLGDKVFITCYSGYGYDGLSNMDDLRLHVLCCQQADGKTVWETTLTPKLPEQDRVRDHGYAASTPATDGQRLYVFFGKSGVYAFDLKDGSELWNTEVGSRTHNWGSGTSPVLFDDLVIVNASVESRKLVALDKATGEKRWEADGMDAAWNTPLLVDVGGRQELVVSVRGKLLGFDPASGEQLWNCRGVDDYVCPSVVARDGIVYACGGRGKPTVAVKAGGRGDVSSTHFLWQSQANSNVPSPVLSGEHLYFVNHRGEVFCIEAATGDIVYQERLRDAGTVYASAVLADEKLYFVTRNGGTYVVAAKPEFEELAHNEFEDRSIFDGSPAVADGRLFLRSNKFLYCVGAAR